MQSVPALRRFGQSRPFVSIVNTERDPSIECDRVPPRDIGRDQCLVQTRSDTEKVNYWYLVLIRIAQPTVVGSVRIRAHESVVDGLVTLIDLSMYIALIVVPDLSANLWYDSLN